MMRKLWINREYWPEVTDVPHFVVKLDYEGHAYACDDIYFDNFDNMLAELEGLQRDRRGRILLDGGFRFKAVIEIDVRGGLGIGFWVETDAAFPGKMRLEGTFNVDGECSGQVLNRLIGLFRDGEAFSLGGDFCASPAMD
jgi:hypothetical protein